MNCFEEQAYIKKCPICNSKLEVEDVDYNFDGNQNEYSTCNNCHIVFEFFIRYHHLWKYTKQNLIYHSQNDIWELDDEHVETIYVYKGNSK